MNRIEFITSNNLQPYYVNFFDLFKMIYDLEIEYKQIQVIDNNCIYIQSNNIEYIINILNNKVVCRYGHVYTININRIDNNNTIKLYFTFLGVSG